ncbi:MULTISPECIES: tetratricopeptide repeat-containing sulfotransferase family protein [unclassified Novosphingobium]|uniref:tetratricopeptide repeat-containing sulfotransferase family protein n=1 Tax=unclassified Novosphingobium TaxID=2644732 RepID=UPI00146B30A4|nr:MULTISPECIES: tetratricopeptide repeat-containing sulfotransferase family protein [unclassified Novosphingobium]
MLHVTTDPLAEAAEALAANPAKAERLARTLSSRDPADPRPRLILASALRRLGRPAHALPILLDLARAWPKAARTRYELGLALCGVGRGQEGDQQLDTAVALDPRHAEAWRAIADRAFACGAVQRERRALAALARLDADHSDLGRAAELVALDRHDEADPILRSFCRAHPHHAEGARLLAACHIAHRTVHAAETLLRHALSLDPQSKRIRFDLAHALFAARLAQQALTELAPLLAAEPDNPAYLNLQAACLGLLGDDKAAEAINARLAEAFPANPGVAVNHGHAARTAGLRDTAIRAYRRATILAPHMGEAWWGLANLKIGALSDADEAQMRGLLGGSLPADDRMRLSYALGRRLEDAGDAAGAFALYAQGAALARVKFGGADQDYAAQAHDVCQLYTPEFLAARSGQGSPDAAPIFIVGLPRSGSTLVEQILASHPAIEGTMELPYIGSLVGRIEREGGATRIASASPAQLRDWGEEYLALARVHCRLGRTHFIDKMPNNFRHIGLIRLILPEARIIDVRRNPMAACFSGFKQLFAEGQEFSYDLEDLAAYYRHYLAIVRHFHAVAPGAVHTLVYEDLVDDTEGQVRALLAALGLPFDPACLRFFENDRAVRTVSSEQVRQPIYRSGLDQWRKFEPFLAPLAQGLGDDCTGWRA